MLNKPLWPTEAEDEIDRLQIRFRQEMTMAACVPEEYWTILHDLRRHEAAQRAVFLSSAPSAKNWLYDRFMEEDNRG